jgi:hypothetical protein
MSKRTNNKQTNKQTNKQNKQTNKQTNKQNKQTNKQSGSTAFAQWLSRAGEFSQLEKLCVSNCVLNTQQIGAWLKSFGKKESNE